MCSIAINNITVTGCSSNTLICYTASTEHNNITVIAEDIVIITMDIPDNDIYNTTILLEYESGQLFSSTESEISK